MNIWPFNLKSRLALLPPKADEKPEEGWEETFDERQKMFSDAHNHLLSLRQSSFEKSDELIVAVSSAFLGLSVGFIKDIVPLQRSVWMSLLVLSWPCFFGAILTNFISHFWARNAIESQTEALRHYYLEGYSKYLDPSLNRWTRLTEICNTVAALLFGLGVLLTLIFVSTNVLFEQTFQAAKAKKESAAQTINNKADEPAKAQPHKPPPHSAPNQPRPQSTNAATNSTRATPPASQNRQRSIIP